MRKKAAAELKIDYASGVSAKQLRDINDRVELMMGKVGTRISLTSGNVADIKGSGRSTS